MKFKVSYEIYVVLLEFGIFAIVAGICASGLEKVMPEKKTVRIVIALVIATIAAVVAYMLDVPAMLA